MKRVSLSILFLALLLLSSMASARIPYENNKDKNDARGEAGLWSCPVPCPNGRCCYSGERCCGNLCCTNEEYAEFLKAKSLPHN